METNCETDQLYVGPERNLFAGLLINALADYYGIGSLPSPDKTPKMRQRLFRRARNWIFSNNHGMGRQTGITFLAVCEVLELDPGCVRRAVKNNSIGLQHLKQSFFSLPEDEDSTNCKEDAAVAA